MDQPRYLRWSRRAARPLRQRAEDARLVRDLVQHPESTPDGRRRDLTRDAQHPRRAGVRGDRKSTRLNSSHQIISYAVFCLKKKKITTTYKHEPTYHYRC